MINDYTCTACKGEYVLYCELCKGTGRLPDRRGPVRERRKEFSSDRRAHFIIGDRRKSI